MHPFKFGTQDKGRAFTSLIAVLIVDSGLKPCWDLLMSGAEQALAAT